MPAQNGSSRETRPQDASELRERALLMIAAFEREEPSPTWPRFREIVECATRPSDLRDIVRECRGMAAAMSPAGRRELERELRERFGARIFSPGERSLAA